MFFFQEEMNMQRVPNHHHDLAFYIGLNLALACAILASMWLY
jgi:Mg2+ and Co2+ transporter CorA